MAEATVTEKDMFLQAFERECETTLKLLKAYPAAKADLKPAEKSRSAKDLAWTFVLEQSIAAGALQGKVDFTQPMPKAPGDYLEIVSAFDRARRETAASVAKANNEDLNRLMQIPVGPGKLGDMRRLDVLWTSLMDQVHHRGQFSVYLRLAGAKVPSIYGPTADEPWM
jgi:uncharacterized damage-inducible protein DinB